jgi:hypothetical protein
MSVFLRRHRDDPSSIELCSICERNTGSFIVWAVVHEDMISHLEGSGIASAIDTALDEDAVTLKADV